MKKIKLCFVLVIVLLLISVFFVACKDDNKFVPEEIGSDGLKFSVYEDGYAVGVEGLSIEDIVIPSTYNYKPIRRVSVFCDDFNSINMPDSVRSVSVLGGTLNHRTKWYEKQPDGVLYLGSVAFGYKGEMPENGSIVIKDGTTAISNGAFRLFPSLTNITIPKSVKYVGNDAFEDTAWYNAQPDGLVYVGNVLYKYKGQMPENTSIKLKKGCLAIADGAFCGDGLFTACIGLTDISIPDSVTSIGNDAFYCCVGLESITIPKSVESVGRSAFRSCINLKSVTVKNKDLRILDDAFYGCSSIRDLSVPNGFLDASNIVFDMMSSKSSTWFDYQPDGVLYVGNVACGYKGDAPTNGEIKIKDGTLGIGSYAFDDCHWLKNISVPESVTAIGKNAFYGCENLKSISIPNSVTRIETGAFEGCSSLTSVVIPNSVTVICESAFKGCSSLTNVVLPTDLLRISDQVFYGTALKSVDIPGTVRSIGNGAFANCTELTRIVIPKGVNYISVNYIAVFVGSGCNTDSAFGGCTKLSDIIVDADNQSYSSVDGVLYNKGKSLLLICPSGKSGSVTIHEGVTSIAGGFDGCKNLTSITLPESLAGDKLPFNSYFNDCTSLNSINILNGNDSYSSIDGVVYNKDKTELLYCPKGKKGTITIPESVKQINDYAFSECSEITTVNWNAISANVFRSVFKNCKNIESINIGEGVTEIDSNVFANCVGLAHITVSGNNSAYSIVDGVLYNKEKTMLVRCPQKKQGTVTILESVTRIGYGAFSGCSGLTNITIHSNVKVIGDFAFENCSGLTSITVPASVTSMSWCVFLDCSGLTSIKYKDTMENWNKKFSGVWLPASCVVICTDGTISNEK